MAYSCRVFRILIASPSDVEDEREIAVSVIQAWNDLNSYSRKIALLPLRWETHTAPEYGTRPQEVINRAIVDDCDLLVGIFWTRIGSPTGMGESGTLEEIERVGSAGKPIMLYFSSVDVDPDSIDLDQIAKLKHFKAKTYPKGLVESYKKTNEFRDKFTWQLELKIRELKTSDEPGEIPLSFEFLSVENGEPIGNSLKHAYDHPNVKNFDVVPIEKHERIKSFAVTAIKAKSYLPLVLAIENSSASGIRNLFVELDMSATSDKVEVSDSKSALLGPDFDLFEITTYMFSRFTTRQGEPLSRILKRDDKLTERVERTLAKFDADQLTTTDRGWKLSFEWEALQPQRIRLVKPVLYVYSPESAKLSLRAKVFANSFPKPFLIEADVSIEVHQSFTDLADLLPNWEKLLLTDNGSAKE